MKVRDLLRWLQGDGWVVVHHRGSHRQLKHPTKPGRVTVAGHPGDTLPPGTLNSIMKQATLRKRGRPVRGYAVIIERAADNFAAYVPDLPGCVATGATQREVEDRIRSAIALHVAGLRADGLEVPEPTSRVAVVEPATAPGF